MKLEYQNSATHIKGLTMIAKRKKMMATVNVNMVAIALQFFFLALGLVIFYIGTK